MTLESQPVAMDPGQGQRSDATRHPRLSWFRDAKFGMFIHWGLYALPAGRWQGSAVPGIGEWIMHTARIPVSEYQRLAESFDPVEFDAQSVVSLAKRAGQKYIVLTAKHHDGFCLWKTEQTPYNVVDATPFGRDIVRELAEECQRQDMPFGLYYSQTQDWHHPGGEGNDWDFDEATKNFDGYIEEFVKPQVRELLTGYGPLCLIWFDTPQRISEKQSRELVDFVHQVQPECLVNGRIGNALGDYAQARDNRVPDQVAPVDWETPFTMNDTWGFKTDDDRWKSVEDLLGTLVDVASKGGNILLNVGPDASGRIPTASVERLEAMGRWLDEHGHGVYGARPGPVQDLDWCRSTQGRGRTYLYILRWPDDGRFRLPADIPIRQAYLADGYPPRPLTVRRDGNELEILADPAPPPTYLPVVVLEHDETAAECP